MERRDIFIKVLPLLFGVIVSPQSPAQNTASITGVVIYQNAALVPAVQVSLLNNETGIRYTTFTNSSGSYALSDVKLGPGYEIAFSHDGFKPYSVSNIYMNVDSTRTQNARLVVAGAVESALVSAISEDVSLDTTDATIGNGFQVQMLCNLPVEDRDSPAALFYQQPGVTLSGAVTTERPGDS